MRDLGSSRFRSQSSRRDAAATLHQACQQTITDLLDDLLPARRSRSYERVKRPAKNTYPTRKHDHVRHQ
jgi:hypothetical protein